MFVWLMEIAPCTNSSSDSRSGGERGAALTMQGRVLQNKLEITIITPNRAVISATF